VHLRITVGAEVGNPGNWREENPIAASVTKTIKSHHTMKVNIDTKPMITDAAMVKFRPGTPASRGVAKHMLQRKPE
jgi:hypothetical protein